MDMMTTPFFRTLIERAGQANASLQSLHDLIDPASTESPEPEPGDDEASPPSSVMAQPCSIEQQSKPSIDQLKESEVAAAAQLFFADLLTDLQRLQAALATRTTHFTELLTFVERQGTGFGQALGDGYFSALPDELFWHILSFLSPLDASSACKVSRKWRLMCDDPLLWRSFYKSEWSEDFTLREALLLAKLRMQEERRDDGDSRAPGSTDTSDSVEANLKLERSAHAKAAEINWKKCYVDRQIIDSYWRKGHVKSVSILEGHSAWISCLRFNDSKIVSGAGDKTIRVWDLHTEKLEKTLKAPRGVLCLQFDEQKIVSGYMDNTIVIWDMAEGRRINTIKGHAGRVWAVQFDDQKIVSGAADKSIRLWDLATLQCTHSINGAHTDGISCLQFNENNIVSGAADSVVKVWDMRTYRCTQTLKGEHNVAVFCVALDDKTVLSGSHDSTLKQWDLRTGRCMYSYVGHQQGVFGVQFDPYKIVSCAGDHTIKMWDRKTGKDVATFAGHKDAIRALQYDDTKIVSGSSTQDKSIRIWKLA